MSCKKGRNADDHWFKFWPRTKFWVQFGPYRCVFSHFWPRRRPYFVLLCQARALTHGKFIQDLNILLFLLQSNISLRRWARSTFSTTRMSCRSSKEYKRTYIYFCNSCLKLGEIYQIKPYTNLTVSLLFSKASQNQEQNQQAYRVTHLVD